MRKKILITGGTGHIGKKLAQYLYDQGHDIFILSRKPRNEGVFKYYTWNVENEYIDEEALNVDYIIHLAAEGLGDKRWTAKRKVEIVESRIKTTQLLLKYLKKMKGPKPSYIGASAIGIYGNNDILLLSETETSNDEKSFLVTTTRKWEKAHNELEAFVQNWCLLRIGIVFSKNQGALKSILMPFNFRIGNYFGDGHHAMSWIHINDLCRIFNFVIENNINGIYNAVAPNYVTGKELIKTIATVKTGPFLCFGVPEFILKLIFGEMSEVILTSTTVSAEKLVSENFTYEYPEITAAIKDLLKH